MRVLVTGSSGFLGGHLCRHLLADGFEVFGAHPAPAATGSEVPERQLDILDRGAVGNLVDDLRPSAIVHLAGLSHVGASWDRIPEYFAINYVGVEHVLDAAKGVRFLLASTSEVYGQVSAENQPIGEETPLAPSNPYALTKAAAERLVLRAGGVVVRMFNVVGPGQSPSFALPDFARQLAEQVNQHQAVLKVGNLEARRDFLHVRDAVSAYSHLIRKGTEGEVYNLGSGKAFSIREALDELIRVSALDVEVEIDPSRIRPIDIPLLCADNSKLGSLGWRPRSNLSDALRDLWHEVAAGCLASA